MAMNAKHILVVAIVSTLIAAFLWQYGFLKPNEAKKNYSDVFIGIDAAYDSPEEIKTLVDAASPYTNFFVIGSTGITFNTTKLDDLCQYIYDKGLSFIIFTDSHDVAQPSNQYIASAKARWGDRFMGLYVYDEVGGKQLDMWQVRPVHEADNYSDARNQFVAHLSYLARNYTGFDNVKVYSSDYALYWFDYAAGYDAIFAEFGWNYSRQLNIALVRGAATAQNKEWGAVITWTYDESPYIESREQLYDDLVLAYQNGAKYILIFDTNANFTHGILGEEHMQALKQFSEYAHKNPRTESPASERVSFVLPEDFAYGFRGPEDKIWGLWEANSTSLSYDLSVKLGDLLTQYGSRLDIIYDDPTFPVNTNVYSRTIFWNGTVVG